MKAALAGLGFSVLGEGEFEGDGYGIAYDQRNGTQEEAQEAV
jgi:hypothetical protein